MISSMQPLLDEKGTFTMEEYYDPCSAKARFLIMRVMAAWCGPCQWQAAHTGELLRADFGDRLQVLDVLVRDQQNRLATVDSLKAFLPYYDMQPRIVTEIGDRIPSYFHVYVGGVLRFPFVVVINRQNMKMMAILNNPDPETLQGKIRQFIAQADGAQVPQLTPPALRDGRFTRDRWEMIQAMRIGTDWQPPPDPTNKVESNSDAVALGKALFNDVALTSAGSIGCVTCHPKSSAFMDGRATAKGITPTGDPAIGERNTPWLGGAAANRFQFWDGRADSLWSQALGPFENDHEISSDRLYVARTSLSRYLSQYEKIFGTAPDISDTVRFPLHARPGMATWEQMAEADRDTVNRIYSNLGKTIGAYMRGIKPLPVAIDRYAGGDTSALTDEEKDGLKQFFDVGCIQCHHGPMLDDRSFHGNYFPTGRADGYPDRGRDNGIQQLLSSEFRGDGRYSDDPKAASWLIGMAPAHTDYGQFRTSSLRGVADTAPYTHGGQRATLDDVVQLYAEGGLPDGDPLTGGNRDITIVRFNKDDPKNVLLAKFLRTMKAAVVSP